MIVPNPDIGPEYTYNVDLGFTQNIKNIRFEVTGFYTWFRNAIVLDQYQFNGYDSIDYIGVKSQVLANQNKAHAYLYGASLNASWNFLKNTAVEGIVNYTYGRLPVMKLKYRWITFRHCMAACL